MDRKGADRCGGRGRTPRRHTISIDRSILCCASRRRESSAKHCAVTASSATEQPGQRKGTRTCPKTRSCAVRRCGDLRSDDARAQRGELEAVVAGESRVFYYSAWDFVDVVHR